VRLILVCHLGFESLWFFQSTLLLAFDENGKLIGNGYLGIGINIMQDNGELIDIVNGLAL
jgi:hypothetical protein